MSDVSASPPAPDAAQAPARPAWTAFDELKEWNAQAGRLAALASFLLAVIVATGFRPLLDRYSVIAATFDVRAILVVIVGVLTQILLGLVFLCVIGALWEVVPAAPDAEQPRAAVTAKRSRCKLALVALVSALLGMLLTTGLDQMDAARALTASLSSPSAQEAAERARGLITTTSLTPIIIGFLYFITLLLSKSIRLTLFTSIA